MRSSQGVALGVLVVAGAIASGQGCANHARDCRETGACVAGDDSLIRAVLAGAADAGPACDAAACDDGNPCTQDGCGEDGGCSYVPLDYEIDDGEECTITSCVEGTLSEQPAEPGHLCDDGRVCDAGGACAECGATLGCPQGYECATNEGRCKGLAGTTCAAAADCLSGFCADAVCCDGACDEPCESCDQAGSKRGQCHLFPGGRADDLCPSDSPVCAYNGDCVNKKSNGEACDASMECVGVCADGQCGLTDTYACLDGTDCLSGYCDPETGMCASPP